MFEYSANIESFMNSSPRSLVGNNVVDYFTFTQRLETKGKYNINFYEFISLYRAKQPVKKENSLKEI